MIIVTGLVFILVGERYPESFFKLFPDQINIDRETHLIIDYGRFCARLSLSGTGSDQEKRSFSGRDPALASVRDIIRLT